MKIAIQTYAQILESTRPLIDFTTEDLILRMESALQLEEATLKCKPDSFEATIVRETAKRIIDQSLQELTFRN